jgi:pre-mRNA-processing factor 40
MSAASVWKEATSPDGRTYYYNTATNATTWEKPAELVSSFASHILELC